MYNYINGEEKYNIEFMVNKIEVKIITGFLLVSFQSLLYENNKE